MVPAIVEKGRREEEKSQQLFEKIESKREKERGTIEGEDVVYCRLSIANRQSPTIIDHI